MSPIRRRRERPGYSDTLTRIERLREGGGDWPDWRKTVIDGLEELAELGEDMDTLERRLQDDHDRRIEKLEHSRASKTAVDELLRRLAHLEAIDKDRRNIGKQALHWLLRLAAAVLVLYLGRFLK